MFLSGLLSGDGLRSSPSALESGVQERGLTRMAELGTRWMLLCFRRLGWPERGLLDSPSSSWSSDGAVVSGGAGEAAEGDAGGDAAAADSSIAAAASVRTSWTFLASRSSPFLMSENSCSTNSHRLLNLMVCLVLSNIIVMTSNFVAAPFSFMVPFTNSSILSSSLLSASKIAKMIEASDGSMSSPEKYALTRGSSSCFLNSSYVNVPDRSVSAVWKKDLISRVVFLRSSM
mmetsp:Transcript_25197/g.35316  ORF Transcript_25197/g.35316 Transcript_25197/m.35316 type:complete len:231 (+) Transcript_25197:143-835(+)